MSNNCGSILTNSQLCEYLGYEDMLLWIISLNFFGFIVQNFV